MTKEAKTQAAPATQPTGWDRSKKHYGVFTTFRSAAGHGLQRVGYLEFQDVEGPLRGFACKDLKSGKEFKPGLRLLEERHITASKLRFKLIGSDEAHKQEAVQLCAEYNANRDRTGRLKPEVTE